jgi:hypothetical protein
MPITILSGIATAASKVKQLAQEDNVRCGVPLKVAVDASDLIKTSSA